MTAIAGVEPGLYSLNTLLDIWEKLGQRERIVLLAFGQRLLNGQKKYGPLTFAKKVWTYEAIEEALDASVYLVACLQDKVESAFHAAIIQAEQDVLNGGSAATAEDYATEDEDTNAGTWPGPV